MALYLAWHIEAFSRQKKLPDLQALLDRNNGESATPDKPMTAAEVRATVSGLAARPLSDKEKQMLAKRKARAKGKR